MVIIQQLMSAQTTAHSLILESKTQKHKQPSQLSNEPAREPPYLVPNFLSLFSSIDRLEKISPLDTRFSSKCER